MKKSDTDKKRGGKPRDGGFRTERSGPRDGARPRFSKPTGTGPKAATSRFAHAPRVATSRRGIVPIVPVHRATIARRAIALSASLVSRAAKAGLRARGETDRSVHARRAMKPVESAPIVPVRPG